MVEKDKISFRRTGQLNKKFVPIAVILVVFLGVAVAGYVHVPAEQDVPARVVMDNNGGRVIFTHAVHAEEYGAECDDCHHDDIGHDVSLACGTCHPAAFDEQFRAEHAAAFPSEEACLRCHDDVPQGPLAEEDRPSVEDIPLRADAFHAQCMSCHEENGGPYGEDSCYECHAR